MLRYQGEGVPASPGWKCGEEGGGAVSIYSNTVSNTKCRKKCMFVNH